MAIKFFNIRSKEVLVADTEEKISALWSSSDHSPNITQGQDFGWRLAPEVVVEMKRIKQDRRLLESIAHTYNRPLEDVGEPEILQYISDRTNAEDAPMAEDGDYTDEYEQEIRALELAQIERAHAEAANKMVNAPTTTDTTTESLEALEKRVALEERLAAARASGATVSEQTATTTTEAPVTTTTTTKKR